MQRLAMMCVAAVGIAAPLLAAAQTDPRSDLAYCRAMSDIYVRYIGHDESNAGSFLRRGDAEGYVAVAKCREGNAAAAIPVLERKLTDARFTLPGRG